MIQGRSSEYGHEGEEKERRGAANGLDKDFGSLESLNTLKNWSESLYLILMVVIMGGKRYFKKLFLDRDSIQNCLFHSIISISNFTIV